MIAIHLQIEANTPEVEASNPRLVGTNVILGFEEIRVMKLNGFNISARGKSVLERRDQVFGGSMVTDYFSTRNRTVSQPHEH
jgi:hypothetical protein